MSTLDVIENKLIFNHFSKTWLIVQTLGTSY